MIIINRDSDNTTCEYKLKRPCLDAYKIIKKLGQGGEATVYLIQDRKTLEYRAAKFVPAYLDDIDYKITEQDDCFPYAQSLQDDIVKSEKLLRSLGVGVKILEIAECDFLYTSNTGTTETAKSKSSKNGSKTQQPYQSKMIVIVMELYSMTLLAYKKLFPRAFESEQDKIQSKLDNLLQKITNSGYEAQDYHDENVMLKLDASNNIIDVNFIDLKLAARM